MAPGIYLAGLRITVDDRRANGVRFMMLKLLPPIKMDKEVGK